MNETVQGYKIVVRRNEQGKWLVTGFWDISKKVVEKLEWDMDGATRVFNTRKEALEFCMTQDGIPE